MSIFFQQISGQISGKYQTDLFFQKISDRSRYFSIFSELFFVYTINRGDNMNKLHLAQLPTPIEKIDYLSDKYKPNIFVKRDDLTDSVASGNKIRKLEYSVAEALSLGCDTLITNGGFQSNHCRSTAAVAAKLGLKCILILRKEPGENIETANFLLDHMLGADIRVKEHDDFQAHKDEMMQEVYQEVLDKGGKPYIIPMGASNGIGTLGYIEAFDEILEYEKKTGIVFDTIVDAVGSGGTYTGLYLGNELRQAHKDIVGINVCDDADFFIKEINSIIDDTLPHLDVEDMDRSHIHIIDGYVGRGYSLSRKEELEAISDLSRHSGIILDPVYTGKAYYGLIHELEKGTFDHAKNILFMHTGGIYGLFSKSKEIISA